MSTPFRRSSRPTNSSSGPPPYADLRAARPGAIDGLERRQVDTRRRRRRRGRGRRRTASTRSWLSSAVDAINRSACCAISPSTRCAARGSGRAPAASRRFLTRPSVCAMCAQPAPAAAAAGTRPRPTASSASRGGRRSRPSVGGVLDDPGGEVGDLVVQGVLVQVAPGGQVDHARQGGELLDRRVVPRLDAGEDVGGDSAIAEGGADLANVDVEAAVRALAQRGGRRGVHGYDRDPHLRGAVGDQLGHLSHGRPISRRASASRRSKTPIGRPANRNPYSLKTYADPAAIPVRLARARGWI